MIHAEKKYDITIVYPEHTGAGSVFAPTETFKNCTKVQMDEIGLYFVNADGKPHWFSRFTYSVVESA